MYTCQVFSVNRLTPDGQVMLNVQTDFSDFQIKYSLKQGKHITEQGHAASLVIQMQSNSSPRPAVPVQPVSPIRRKKITAAAVQMLICQCLTSRGEKNDFDTVDCAKKKIGVRGQNNKSIIILNRFGYLLLNNLHIRSWDCFSSKLTL